MALNGLSNPLDKKNHVQIGNRNDVCYLCLREVVGKDDKDYNRKVADLKGKFEGKPMLKVGRAGTDINICLDHIHKIAEENPLA